MSVEQIKENIKEDINSCYSHLAEYIDFEGMKRCIKECVRIELSNKNITEQGSKLFGYPFIPFTQKIPLNKQQRPLSLLMQINLSELPSINNYLPKDGLLQFYIDTLEWYDLRHPDRYRVNYVSKEELLQPALDISGMSLLNENITYRKGQYSKQQIDTGYILTGVALDFFSDFSYRFSTYDSSDDYLPFTYNFIKKEKYAIFEKDEYLYDELSEVLDSYQDFIKIKLGGYPLFIQMQDDFDVDNELLLLELSSLRNVFSFIDLGKFHFIDTYKNIQALDFSKARGIFETS
ncbi:MAG: hypothetical protein QG673_190 [Pseudomonadota bacterium]|nr:hypothetical protein [Pseudomonadota bacterium]